MPLPPHGGGPGGNAWWVIWITDTTRSGRTMPYAIEQAASSSAASQIVSNAGQSVLSVDGPYPSQAAARSHVTTTAKAKGGVPVDQTPAVKSVTGGGLGITSPLAAIGDFFGRLTQANTWIRVGEVLLGLILIGVGIAHMTHAVPLATKVAGIAAKGAI